MQNFTIRKASASDAKDLTELAARTFIETFEKDNEASDMRMYLEKSFHESVQLNEILDPKRFTFLAYADESLVAYMQLFQNKPEACVMGKNPLELVRIYVAKEFHGAGLANTLMEKALELAKSLSAASIWLGVWEKNFRAQSFYRKWGFNEVGSHVFLLGRDEQRDLILERHF